jgi:hypothetical protein
VGVGGWVGTMSSGSSGSRVAKPVPCFWSICDLTRRILGCVWVESGGSGCVVCVVHEKVFGVVVC